MNKENNRNNHHSARLSVAILAGGKGTRLWPLSTPERPKPFVDLGSLGRLMDRTVERARSLRPATLFTVGEARLEALLPPTRTAFLPEPAARNTAAAVALAGVETLRVAGPDANLLVLPADHWIENLEAFGETVRTLAKLCSAPKALGVMGIEPHGPETAYGYIEACESLEGGYSVARFVEKPGREEALRLLQTGRATWNSGMFLFPLGTLKEEMVRHCPRTWEAAEAWLEAGNSKPYLELEPTSVDYALMEKTERVVVVPADFSWSDVGTFPALHAILPKDDAGNSGWGPGTVTGCTGCLVVTKRAETLVKGLRGCVVVERDKGLLVLPLEGAGDIRRDVEALLAPSRRVSAPTPRPKEKT